MHHIIALLALVLPAQYIRSWPHNIHDPAVIIICYAPDHKLHILLALHARKPSRTLAGLCCMYKAVSCSLKLRASISCVTCAMRWSSGPRPLGIDDREKSTFLRVATFEYTLEFAGIDIVIDRLHFCARRNVESHKSSIGIVRILVVVSGWFAVYRNFSNGHGSRSPTPRALTTSRRYLWGVN